MNPNDVNRLNYNCFYIGSQLDTLVRSKMRSESFITPLKVTPKFYEDELSKKMKLLGQHGSYYPEEISPYTEEYARQMQEGRTPIPSLIPSQQSQYQQPPSNYDHLLPQMPLQSPNPRQMDANPNHSQPVQQEIPRQAPIDQPQSYQSYPPYQPYPPREEPDNTMRARPTPLSIEKANNLQYNNQLQSDTAHIQKYQNEIQQPHYLDLPHNRHNFHYINKY